MFTGTKKQITPKNGLNLHMLKNYYYIDKIKIKSKYSIVHIDFVLGFWPYAKKLKRGLGDKIFFEMLDRYDRNSEPGR